jgi:hypothetical protein
VLVGWGKVCWYVVKYPAWNDTNPFTAHAELYRREGKAEKFARQTEINQSLQVAMAELLASTEAGNVSTGTVVAPLSDDEGSMEVDAKEERSPGVDEMDTA